MEGKKRFAVLQCAEDSEYMKKKYGGYFRVFVTMLAEEGEVWDGYRVVSGEFPDDNDVTKYDGFVITGSSKDAHGHDGWIYRLITLLQRLDCLKKKVLGICFGHQILSRAIGGKTGRSLTGWDVGVRTIQLSTSATSSKLFSSLKLSLPVTIIECHQDEVIELPPKAEVIAWSNKSGIEMFRYGDHMMGIQGHPEYNDDILLHLIDRLLQSKQITDAYGKQLRANMLESELPNRDVWRSFCLSFLKGSS